MSDMERKFTPEQSQAMYDMLLLIRDTMRSTQALRYYEVSIHNLLNSFDDKPAEKVEMSHHAEKTDMGWIVYCQYKNSAVKWYRTPNGLSKDFEQACLYTHEIAINIVDNELIAQVH